MTEGLWQHRVAISVYEQDGDKMVYAGCQECRQGHTELARQGERKAERAARSALGSKPCLR